MNDFSVEPDEPITEQEIEDFYQVQGGGGGGFDDSLVEGLAHEDTEMQRMVLEKVAREEGLSKEEITKRYHAYIDMRVKEQIRRMQIIREIEKRDIARNISTNPEKAEKFRSQLEDTEKRIRRIKESLQR
ncbi:MAG: hypothetical protein M3136_07795 [Thermoproteota archaeon]|jgi:hypothetical protein|nr:hypothetical protein [Thermoproteota archaeon]